MAGPKIIDPADVEVRNVEWLIRHFLRRDTLNLIQGHGGTNKGTWCCHVGARATRGELSPEGKPIMVLYACAEDEKETELKPRLIAANADLRYVRFIEDVVLPRDIRNGRLQACVREVGAGLLFIDPLVTYLERMDAHKDQEVKQALTPILQMAQDERCTIVGVHHFTKDTRLGALLSGNGSGAFGNTARVVLAMVADNEDGAHRILEVVKTNGGPCHVNRLYRLELKPVEGLTEPLPVLVDVGESAKSADVVLASGPAGRGSKRQEAREIILRELANGPKSMDYLKAKAAADADSAPSGETTWRAANELKAEGRIRSYRESAEDGTAKRWLWALVDAEPTSATEPAIALVEPTSPDSPDVDVGVEVGMLVQLPQQPACAEVDSEHQRARGRG
jgi:AAA domain